jgi:hypothetical protein
VFIRWCGYSCFEIRYTQKLIWVLYTVARFRSIHEIIKPLMSVIELCEDEIRETMEAFIYIHRYRCQAPDDQWLGYKLFVRFENEE